MMLVLNLSRSVTVPCGKQAHILEVMERKRTVSLIFFCKRGSPGNGSESPSNNCPTVSYAFPQSNIMALLRRYFASLITLDDGNTAQGIHPLTYSTR
jgi:hypothetical protein